MLITRSLSEDDTRHTSLGGVFLHSESSHDLVQLPDSVAESLARQGTGFGMTNGNQGATNRGVAIEYVSLNNVSRVEIINSPTPESPGGALAGFAVCGLHPKVFPIAIAAGHQIWQVTERPERGLCVLVFAVISVIPAVVPAIIEVFSPGASGRTKDAFERIMKVHGRWITAVLLLAAAAFVGNNAWNEMPR